MKFQYPHLHQPNQRGKIIRHHVPGRAIFFRDLDPAHSVGYVLPCVLLIKALLLVPLRTADQGQRPTFEMRQNPVADGLVIPSQRKFCDALLGKQYPFRVTQRDTAYDRRGFICFGTGRRSLLI